MRRIQRFKTSKREIQAMAKSAEAREAKIKELERKSARRRK